jgi:hypothetical protein
MAPLAPQDSFDIDSPKFVTEDAGIFASVPQHSFDTDSDNEAAPLALLSASQPIEVVTLFRDFQARFTSLKTKWTQAFLEVDTSHSILVKDLKAICQWMTALKQHVITLQDSHSSKDLQLTAQLQSHLTWQEHSTAIESIQTQQDEHDFQLQTIQSSLLALETKLASVDRCLKEFDKWFTIIFPIHKETRQQKHVADGSSINSLILQLQELSDKVASLEQTAWQQINSIPSPTSVTQPVNIEAELKDIHHHMKVLQHRIVGGGVKIDTKVFQSFGDVQVWVKAELPIHRYGLFVDAVSILDFFLCLGQIDVENQVSMLHNANKAGFTSIYESCVATSVQNIFPKVFGKGDAHQYLLAIQQLDKWDDGTDGLVYQITWGMTDVETQLSSAIDSVLEHYPEACTIASQCLFKAKRFVIDLCTFMSKDYFKWMARGHTKQDAWNMTSLCVRWVFEEIHSERVVARDMYDPNDLEFTTAKMLWASWKAHCIMEHYLKHHFYEHPSISAVLARHLADNYTKPSTTPNAQLATLEKTIKSLSTRLDKLEVRQSDKDRIKDKNKFI